MEEPPGAVLVVEQGMGDASVIPLEQACIVLGKLAESDVVVENPYISRRHAEIKQDDKGFIIRDLGSKNGTFINGARLGTDEHRLKTGDRIELALGQVIMRFESWSSTITLPAYAPARPGDLAVEPRSREVLIRGRKVDPSLSRKEFDILAFLHEHRGGACSKDQIASRGWPDREVGDVSDQEIEQCIRRLRLRIEPNPSRPQFVLTVRGYGYKLAD